MTEMVNWIKYPTQETIEEGEYLTCCYGIDDNPIIELVEYSRGDWLNGRIPEYYMRLPKAPKKN